MKVGVPKEVKNSEDRVALTPSGAHELVRAGHQVFLEERAGVEHLEHFGVRPAQRRPVRFG